MLKRMVFLRSQPVKSQMQEVMFSNTAMTVDIAAKSMNRKKRVPQNTAAAHSVEHVGEGDEQQVRTAVGVNAEAEAGGKIIRPETIATKVSSAIIHIASPVRRCSLPM